jgi:hypothetical protein
MGGLIDLRRFVRAGDAGAFRRADGADVRVIYGHVSTLWATVQSPRGAVATGDALQAILDGSGTRVLVTLEAIEVVPGVTGDRCELSVTGTVVLADRREAPRATTAIGLVAIHVRSDGFVVRTAAVATDVSTAGVQFEAEDRFAPGDEVTLTQEGGEGFRVRVRVVRRTATASGARYGCRVVAATAADEERLLATTRA